MKATLAALATVATVLTLAAPAAKADVIRCVFTEPFVDTTYSMTQSTLTVNDSNESKPKVIKNVSFQIVGPGKFQLVAKNGAVIQELELTMNGSDGMSDYVYPYDVKMDTMKTGANNGIGGCSSNKLKPVEQAN